MRNLFRKDSRYPTVPAQARPTPPGKGDRTADGLWIRCANERCRELLYSREYEHNLKVCQKCHHHARLSARERIQQLVDEGSFVEWDAELRPADPLDFQTASEHYPTRLRTATERTGEPEAAVAGSA